MLFKCFLCNTDAIGQRCGYGEGTTPSAAIADALKKAQTLDPNATYNPVSREVEFRGSAGVL